MSILTPVQDLTVTNPLIRALIYGTPGVGKSTLALSMPNPVLIDADGGVMRIRSDHRAPTLRVSKYQDVLDLLDSNELKGFQTIVIDTVGKLLDMMSEHIMSIDPKMKTRNGTLQLQGYGARKAMFLSMLTKIKMLGMHAVFVAHDIEEKSKSHDNQDVLFHRPDIGGSSRQDLMKDIDIVGFMVMTGKDRTIYFSPQESYYAKNSAGIEDVLKVPNLQRGEENNFLKTVIDRVIEAMQEEDKKTAEYRKLMGKLKKDVDGITDLLTLNDMLIKLGTMKHLFDSKISSWKLLQEKAKTLGFVFIRDLNAFGTKQQEEEQTNKVETENAVS